MLPKLILMAFALASVNETALPTRRIEERFLSPCCWRESLALHRSPDADAMRAEVRQLLEAGKSEDEIVALYVSRYGQRILREPQGRPAIWLQTLPLVMTAIGFAFVTWYIVHARRRTPDATCADGPFPDVEDWL